MTAAHRAVAEGVPRARRFFDRLDNAELSSWTRAKGRNRATSTLWQRVLEKSARTPARLHWISACTLNALEDSDFARFGAKVIGNHQRNRRGQRVLTETGAGEVDRSIEVLV